MRVTQGMIINNSLNGLFKNMNDMNKLYGQMTTGKKIQTVSEDPIIAGRALKLKTTVLETTQYQSNVKEANSWMEITEAALDNMTNILKEIRTKCVNAANGTLKEEDKNAIKTDVAQLMDQLLKESNNTYGGRYIFSGYKTDEPLILTKEVKLDELLTVQKDMTIPAGTKITAGSVIKEGSTVAEGSLLDKDTIIPAGSVLKAGSVLSAEDMAALKPGFVVSATQYTLDNDYTIPAGTDLSSQAIADLGTQGIVVASPVPDGGCTIPAGKTLQKATAEEILGVTVSGDSYVITKDITVPTTPTTGYKVEKSITLGAGCEIKGDITLEGNSSLGGGTILREDSTLAIGTTLPKGAFNPKVYGKTDNQSISYEIGVNNTIDVNTLGMDSILSEFMASMEEMITMVNASQGDNPKYTQEELYAMFNEKLGEVDKTLAQVSEKTADLGSKMKRAEYVESRLVDQKTTFTSLLSESEDIDIEEAYVQFNVQYATYQSALQATSKVIMNTLADYL